ncbi:MAG: hypothetical protein IKQ39_07715 [Oscillospiraceae bacterium]|nr:hypothetical protein [Oscillospiraceae bacterium]
MTNKDLLDAIGRLPQDLLDEGLPKKTAQAAEAGDAPEIKMTGQPEKRSIRLRMGAAVAAMCLLLNGALIGGLILANRKSKENRAQISLANELSEQKLETPGYVRDMQDYYTTVTGRECTVDFTGMGKEFDDRFELEDGAFTIHLTGMVSDGFVLYTMFDVIPRDASEPFGGFNAYITEESMLGGGCTLLRREKREDGAENLHYVATHLRTDPNHLMFDSKSEELFCICRNKDDAKDNQSDEAAKPVNYGPVAESAPFRLDFIAEPEYISMTDPDFRTGGSVIEKAVVTPLGMYLYAKNENITDSAPYVSGLPKSELSEENEQLILPDGSSKTVKWLDGWKLNASGESHLRMLFAEPLGKDTPADSVIRIGETEIPVSDLSRYFSGAQPEPQIQQADNKPAYVKWMQTLYDTDYDFTGSGTDLDITWEDHGYRVHMTAAAGDAFRLYYFYDVYPLEGQPYDKDGNRDEYFPIPLFSFYDENGENLGWKRHTGYRIGENPLLLSSETVDGQEVWHMFGRVTDLTGTGMHGCTIYTCLSAQLSGLEPSNSEASDTRSSAEAKEIPNFMQKPEFRSVNGQALKPYTSYAVTQLGIVLVSDDLGELTADEFETMSSQLEIEQAEGEWQCEAFYPGKSAAGEPVAWQDWALSWMQYPVQTTFWNLAGIESGGVVICHFAKPLDIRPSINMYLKLNGVPLKVNNPLPDFITSDAQPAATEPEPDTTTATTQTTASSVLAVNIRAENVTPTGCDIVFTNDANSDVCFGRAFRLLNMDGTPLSPLCELTFTEEALELPAGGTRTEHYDWSNGYGNLEPGSYLFETRVGGTPFTANFTVS